MNIKKMQKTLRHKIELILRFCTVIVSTALILQPEIVYAAEFHPISEVMIIHLIGHFLFLFSMMVLIFTIIIKGLNAQKAWRYIQYSALLFLLWTLDTTTIHFLDGVLKTVKTENISFTQILVMTQNDSSILAWIYYLLKLDHLLCVPAMLFFYLGLSKFFDEHEKRTDQKRLL